MQGDKAVSRKCAILSMVMTVAAAPLTFATDGADSPGPQRVYIGTYTGGASEGIYLLDFDAQTGRLGEPQLAAKVENPS